jgi:hypothetical protein
MLNERTAEFAGYGDARQTNNPVTRTEAPAQQPVLMKLLQPPGVANCPLGRERQSLAR